VLVCWILKDFPDGPFFVAFTPDTTVSTVASIDVRRGSDAYTYSLNRTSTEERGDGRDVVRAVLCCCVVLAVIQRSEKSSPGQVRSLSGRGVRRTSERASVRASASATTSDDTRVTAFIVGDDDNLVLATITRLPSSPSPHHAAPKLTNP
jgi:hypothetical protein